MTGIYHVYAKKQHCVFGNHWVKATVSVKHTGSAVDTNEDTMNEAVCFQHVLWNIITILNFGMKVNSEVLLSNEWPISAECTVAPRRISILLKPRHHSLHE